MKKRTFLKISAAVGIIISTGGKIVKAATEKIIRKIVAPPGAVSIENLVENCIKCNECIDNCPSEVLQPSIDHYGKDSTGIPYLDFTTSFCDNECNTCSTICPTDSIQELSLKEKKRTQIGIAKFNNPKCIVTTDKTSCGACAEVCPTSAITLVNIGESLEIPSIKESYCIGCGACEFACPVKSKDAIYVIGLEEHKLLEEIKIPPVKKLKNDKSKGTFAF